MPRRRMNTRVIKEVLRLISLIEKLRDLSLRCPNSIGIRTGQGADYGPRRPVDGRNDGSCGRVRKERGGGENAFSGQ